MYFKVYANNRSGWKQTQFFSWKFNVNKAGQVRYINRRPPPALRARARSRFITHLPATRRPRELVKHQKLIVAPWERGAAQTFNSFFYMYPRFALLLTLKLLCLISLNCFCKWYHKFFNPILGMRNDYLNFLFTFQFYSFSKTITMI